jgi:predicted amidohydrolase YtcJ
MASGARGKSATVTEQAITVMRYPQLRRPRFRSGRACSFRFSLAGALGVLAAVLMACALSTARADAPAAAETVFLNGNVLTLDAAGTVVQAVAVKDGRILATGSDAQIRELAGPRTGVVDLRGRTVLPGFIDGHVHPSYAVRMIERYLDGRIATTPSVAVLLRKIAARSAEAPAGEWIIVAGSSSSQTRFAERRIPTRAELDAAAPRSPVMFLNGAHESVVNTQALALLGIERGMHELKGAHIDLDADGGPTGVIREGLAIFPDQRIPDDDLRRYYASVIPQMWNARGYTSMYAIAPLNQLGVLKELAPGQPATLRYTIAVHADPAGRFLPAALDELTLGPAVDPAWYRLAGIKVWIDSDVPMRGGAVTVPYAGEAGGQGILNMTQPELDALALRTYRAGFTLLAHATGDRATAMALTAFERVQARAASGTPARGPALQRIEHFGEFMLGPDDLARARRLGVMVNVQPGWIYTLANSTIENLGAERARGAFRFRDMIDAGLEPGFGTDLTGIVLETFDPFLHVWASVTRTADVGVFVPEQAVSVTEALRMLTLWSARAQGEDAIKGSIEPGKLADMVVISDDILRIPPPAIRGLTVLKTIVGGRVVYEAPATDSRAESPAAMAPRPR